MRARLEMAALETPKPGDAAFAGHAVHMIATPQQSLEAAAEGGARSRHRGAHPQRRDGRRIARGRQGACCAGARRGAPRPAFARPCVILSGGETTVTIRAQPGHAKGRGGRAGEFCLGLAGALQGQPQVWALAADTDGIDGVEDNAGAFVTPDTLARAPPRA
jgi:glycerate 2-kinase